MCVCVRRRACVSMCVWLLSAALIYLPFFLFGFRSQRFFFLAVVVVVVVFFGNLFALPRENGCHSGTAEYMGFRLLSKSSFSSGYILCSSAYKLGLTCYYLVVPRFSSFLPSFTEFYRVLSSFTEFYRVLPSFIDFYRVLPSFTEFYRVLPSFTYWIWVRQGSTGSIWAGS